MPRDEYIYSQCLLFVVRKGEQMKVTKSSEKGKSPGSSASSDPSPPKAFVLFSEVFEKKRPDVVELFKENGLDALSLENISSFLLGEDNEVELIALFLDECSSASLNPLTIIADCDNELIRRLFAHSTVCVKDKDCDDVRPAVDETNFEVVKHLFMHKPDVYFRNSRMESVLHLAASFGPNSFLSLILELGGNVDARTHYGVTALLLAARYGFVGGVELLLMKGADIEAQTSGGSTPLHAAARGGHVRVITVLLDQGVDIEAETKYKDTPLLAAATFSHEAAARLLIERGANVQALSPIIGTGLHMPALRGAVSMVELFLRHGVTVDATNRYGQTALHLASSSGHLKVVQALLLNNADVNAKSEDGQTPIHWAAKRRNIEVVKVLMKFGAQVSLKNKEGESVLHCARGCAHSMFQYLLESRFLHPESLRESGIVAVHLKEMRDYPHLRKQSEFSDLSRILAHHIVKICVLQSTDIFEELDPSPFWTDSAMIISDYKSLCTEEVVRLKLTTVGDTDVSYYEFLALDVPEAAKFFCNDSVAEITDSALQEMFPIFGSILSHHFDKGRELKSMLAECIKLCKALFGIPFKKLPSELQERILVDFNYKDLSSLINACHRSNKSSIPDPDN